MVFLISFVIAALFVAFCDKALKKFPQAFYIGAAVLALIFTIFDFKNANQFVKGYIIAMFTKGTLATALFVIVMFTGALKNGSALIKKLMPIRAELSIIASILILIHGFNYGKIYITRLIKAPDSLPAVQIIFVIFSIVMLLIMIPLAVISFKKIRRKMSAKRWKSIQRAAYVFYGLIYLHILLIDLPSAQKGNKDKIINIIVYSIVFISYAVMRTRKAVLKKHKEAGKTLSISFGSAGFALMAAVCALVFIPYAQTLKDVSEPVAYSNTTAKDVDDKSHSLTESSVSDIENTEENNDNSVAEDIDENSDTKKAADTDTEASSKAADKSSDKDKTKSSDKDKFESKSSTTSSKNNTSDTNSKNTQSTLKSESNSDDKKSSSSSSVNSKSSTGSKDSTSSKTTSSKAGTSSKTTSSKADTVSKTTSSKTTSSKASTNGNTTSSKANTSSKTTSSKTNTSNNTASTSSKDNTSSKSTTTSTPNNNQNTNSNITANVSSREEVVSVKEPEPEPEPPTPVAEEPEEPVVQTKYRDGTYTAKTFNYEYDLVVTLTIENDQIVDLEVEAFEDDMWYFERARDKIVPQILEKQSTEDIDAVSESTLSSDAIKKAVEDALKQAEN